MKPIEPRDVREKLEQFRGKDVYLHVETTPGSFFRNAKVSVSDLFLAGEGPYRAAIRMDDVGGWVRVELLTDFEWDQAGRLLLAGHDDKGRLVTALEISDKPFPA